MKIRLVLISALIILGCSKDKSVPDSESINLKINLNLKTDFSLKLDAKSATSAKTDSDFEHIYDTELIIRFTSESSGQSKEVVYDANENESLSISLPYGTYTWEVIPSLSAGTPFSMFLPLRGTSTEALSINQENMDLDLVVETDYALVTVATQNVVAATLISGNVTMALPEKNGQYYGYVLAGLSEATFRVTDVVGNDLSADLGVVETCKHYKYILEASNVGLNVLSCDCEVFEVEERGFGESSECGNLKTFYFEDELLFGPFVNEKVCYDVTGRNTVFLDLYIHDSWDSEVLEIAGISNQTSDQIFSYSFNNHQSFSIPVTGNENWEILSFTENLPSLGYDCNTATVSRRTLKLTLKLNLNAKYEKLEFSANLDGTPNGCQIFVGDESWSFNEIDFQGNDLDALIDIDGNSYNILPYCNQVWTTEDLTVRRYSDGTPIPQVTDPNQWATLNTGAWCYYDNDESKGVLYNWFAINGVHDEDPNTPNKSLAPEGWDVPSSDDIGVLYNCFVELYHCTASGNTLGNFIGKAMASKNLWVPVPETSEHALCTPGYIPENNNESGFNLTPTGIRQSNGTFVDYGLKAFLVAKTQYDANNTWLRVIYNRGIYLDGWYADSKRNGYRVRLVKKG
jgi:uncharacterized protein (TIGR02145 family)